jgi:hypothetical protein
MFGKYNGFVSKARVSACKITTVCLVTIRIQMSKYTIDIPFNFHVFY